ncbi:hypothetical protein MAR_ORF390 [Marseillevirus marseillevirus]|uniref:Uncharacterized protein n=1 Tax=Marseillevirus marseillevirus TaxID=694581 RepID=D2XB26_GBMV|nr:hypothetical protein MAR_ORF390 [Marseillevirus marseillevirus]ADB04153.1 hypothetical protein MAR_ORF390 [Marseillevirus marseillevirus]
MLVFESEKDPKKEGHGSGFFQKKIFLAGEFFKIPYFPFSPKQLGIFPVVLSKIRVFPRHKIFL